MKVAKEMFLSKEEKKKLGGMVRQQESLKFGLSTVAELLRAASKELWDEINRLMDN